MNKKPDPTASTSSAANPGMPTTASAPAQEVRHRLVVPIQTRGNIGKSTETIARCEWMSQRGVAWKGYDLDQFNRTLSTTFPQEVSFLEPGTEPEGEVIRVLRQLNRADVTVIDPAAHLNHVILKALAMVRFPEIAASIQARITVLLFPIDEVSDMDDIAATVAALGSTVDWVVVRNRARTPQTRFFDGSPLEKTLRSYGAAFLDLPALLSDTRNHLRAHEVRLGRGLSPAEALKNPELEIDLVHLFVLEDWLGDAFAQFDAIANHLLPTAKSQAIQPQKARSMTALTQPPRGSSINLKGIL